MTLSKKPVAKKRGRPPGSTNRLRMIEEMSQQPDRLDRYHRDYSQTFNHLSTDASTF